MRTKSLALLALALGCGLVASIGITQVMATRTGDSPQMLGETEGIFVALKEVQMGDVLSAQSVKLEPWPKDKVPAGAMVDLKTVEGRRTKTKLFAGEPILKDKLFRPGEDYIPTSMIPPNYRVVAVKADTQTVGGNLLNPGDRVDVMVHLTQNKQNGIDSTGTRMVLEDIKVFAVNDVVGVGGEKDAKTIKALTVSLLVTPEQAAKLFLAAELGNIRLALRGPDGGTTSGQRIEAKPSELLGISDVGDSSKETLVKEEPKKQGSLLDLLKAAASRPTPDGPTEIKPDMPIAPAAPTWTVRIIKPGGVEDVVLEQDVASADASRSGSPARWHNVTAAPAGNSAATAGGSSAAGPSASTADPGASTKTSDPEPAAKTSPRDKD